MTQRLIPGVGWIDESATAQRLIPGVGWADEQEAGGGDTTDPILTSAVGTATGATTANGSVTTDEAGPAWAVLTTSSTTPGAAQIKAGQDHTGAFAAASDTATLVVGANADVFAFSGLTGSTAYRLHVVQDDTATPTANTSAPITSASSFTTDAPSDTTNPTMNGSITVGTKTANSISISYSAASDNVGVTGYEVSSNGGVSWLDNGTSLSYTFLGLSPLTSYDIRVRAYDAAGNRATPITVNTSTYREGGTGQFIWDNTAGVDGGPDGIMRNDVVLPGDANKWFSFRIITQNLNGGTLDIDPQGTFTFTGAASGSFTYQLEVDGVDVDANGDPGTYESLVTLYDTTVYRPASDVTTTGWTSTGANFFGVLDESPSSDADYVTSPNVSASPGPLVMGIDPIPAGQKVARFRARRTASVGELRQVFLNSSDVEVGATAWVALTGTFALYEPTVYLTGTATKVRVEVRES